MSEKIVHFSASNVDLNCYSTIHSSLSLPRSYGLTCFLSHSLFIQQKFMSFSINSRILGQSILQSLVNASQTLNSKCKFRSRPAKKCEASKSVNVKSLRNLSHFWFNLSNLSTGPSWHCPYIALISWDFVSLVKKLRGLRGTLLHADFSR